MKIVNVSEDWHLEATCEGNFHHDGGCTSTFLLSESDIYPKLYLSEPIFYWVCPKCGHLNIIPNEQIPKYIQNDLLLLINCRWTIWEEVKLESFRIQIENLKRLKRIAEEEMKEHPDIDLLEKLKDPTKMVKDHIKKLEKIKK